MKPSQFNLTSYEGALVDPFYKFDAGRGYFMSMDVTNYSSKEIDDYWQTPGGLTPGIKQGARARGTLELNRRLMRQYFNNGGAKDYIGQGADYMKDFSRFAADSKVDAVTGTRSGSGNMPEKNYFKKDYDKILHMPNETFNVKGVTLKLEKGLNFLGNPFMAPISLNPLLGYKPDGTVLGDINTALDVSMYFGSGVTASHRNIGANTLRSKYWIINNGLIEFKDNWFYMSVTYDYVSTGGATIPSLETTGGIANPTTFLIAPMQMFLLQTNEAFDITLEPSLRKLGHTTRFLKSGNDTELLSDFFVAEVKNSVDNLSDRTAIVLRESASLANDEYDTNKNLSKSIELPGEKGDKSYPEETSSYIYTKASDGTKMLGNAVPLNVKELALFVTPPATQRSMTLNFYNLDNMTSVSNVWLIDRYENNKTVKLTPGYSYDFTSGPSDLKSVDENRFILRFYDSGEDIVKEETPITCYYNTSVLHISGLNENDIDSSVQIYDMQGRLMGKTRVNNYPSMEYVKPLSLGTYIVKISGNRNFTTKFVNLQN